MKKNLGRLAAFALLLALLAIPTMAVLAKELGALRIRLPDLLRKPDRSRASKPAVPRRHWGRIIVIQIDKRDSPLRNFVQKPGLLRHRIRFSPESRARCSSMATDLIGDQSYVELLTCLQMSRDVLTLPKQ